MRWTVSSADARATAAELVVVPIMQKDDQPDLAPLRTVMGGAAGKALKGSGFSAKAEELFLWPLAQGKTPWLLLAGLGARDELSPDTIRHAAGRAAARARAMKAARVLVQLPPVKDMVFDDATFARCWTEGAELGLSPTGELKTEKKKTVAPRAWKFLARGQRAASLRKGLGEGTAFAAGCVLARALVNEPPNILTPAALAARARRMARAEGLACRVLGVPQLRKLRMGGILGVGQGSTNPPRLIEVKYRAPGRGKRPHVALVGKGITFDSGGISLKPGAGMDQMKSDMGGAAAVLGAVLIAARLRLPADVTVVVPAAENMPDGGAVKPADVITMASGKTVEVLNTDAEGRLILADALWYAGRGKPDYLIDAATLTGACVVALGKHFAGLMGNSAALMEALQQAGGETHERVWHLPLVDEHKEIMKGSWADLQNIGGGREGGALTAAAFLSAFVDEQVAWTHLDIAGPSYLAKGDAVCPAGGTGFGARLLARAVQILAG